MADEVYQVNAYQSEASPFLSLKRVAKEEKIQVEMISFQSTSKGFTAECGVRGGYIEFDNIDPKTVQQAVKLVSVRLSPNTTGQLVLDMACFPPQKGDPSYELFHKESQSIMNDLSEKANCISETFNSMTNTSCSKVKGSLFAFPQIKFNESALKAAKDAGLEPDTFYARELLEEAGVCVSSGNIFGQKPGTFHIRLTLMPTVAKVKDALERIRKFNESFHSKYA
eukprot:TRINITY_DN6682_c0_g1_i2.p1 TRINITY_DN6682_c0_g1~~TRINITY_DN6682_c0_g1_i2.p1  ORF type:complete len:225 (-),score=83.70 TRINITY_DN6682_c0_g1_i2:31-705(-)